MRPFWVPVTDELLLQSQSALEPSTFKLVYKHIGLIKISTLSSHLRFFGVLSDSRQYRASSLLAYATLSNITPTELTNRVTQKTKHDNYLFPHLSSNSCDITKLIRNRYPPRFLLGLNHDIQDKTNDIKSHLKRSIFEYFAKCLFF